MAKLNCILFVQDTHVEDIFVNYINHFYSVHLLDTYSSIIEMIEKLQKQRVDVLFMDMSRRDVSDKLLRMIDKPPFIIGLVDNPAEVPQLLEMGFFDCLDSHADLESFCRLMSKVIRIVNHYSQEEKPKVSEAQESYKVDKHYQSLRNFVFIKHKRTTIKVNFDDIMYVKNTGNVLRLECTDGKVYYHTSTLKDFLDKLPPELFFRVNQSIIANYNFIDKLEGKFVYISGSRFKLSRIYASAMKLLSL